MPMTFPIDEDSQIITPQAYRFKSDDWCYRDLPKIFRWDSRAELARPAQWKEMCIFYDYPQLLGGYHAVQIQPTSQGRGTAYVTLNSSTGLHFTKMWSWGKNQAPIWKDYYEPWESAFNRLATSCASSSPSSSRPNGGDCRTEAVLACSQQCSKESTRSMKGFHEVKTTSWTPAQSKKQLQQAQRVVDQTLQILAMGVPVRVPQKDADYRLGISQDCKTLELHVGAETGQRQQIRMPLSQVVDISFGASQDSLVLRFSDVLCREAMELSFLDEDQRLQVALTLKVLRARLQ